MKKSFLAGMKDFLGKFLKSYKDVSRISGGCAYIPPNCLSSQKTEKKGRTVGQSSKLEKC